MKKYTVTGMTCAACSSKVEKTVSSLDGVSSCSVNLLMNTVEVEGNVSGEEIDSALKKVGYGLILGGKKEEAKSSDNDDTRQITKRFGFSLFFLAILMYLSMGYTMLSFPLPSFLEINPLSVGILQLILCSAVMIVNSKFFTNGFKSALHLSPNMDTLISLGSAVSFIYSTVLLFIMSHKVVLGDIHSAHGLLHGLYFESAAMILVLITLGKYLESRSKGKTKNALKGLIDLSPKMATIIKDGEEITVGIDEIRVGDIIAVKPGESFPADAKIIFGSTAADESALTGESIPVDKSVGDTVYTATIHQSGYVKCEVLKIGEDTALASIIKSVTDASASKAPIAKLADKVSGIFVPIVIIISVITTLVWLLVGEDVGYSLARGISVLVISCPCALGLATPVAVMVSSGKGARSGILFKNAASIEEIGKISVVALDKTGTLTEGKPAVTSIHTYNDVTETELLKIAYSIESMSEHPIARAICEKAISEGIDKYEVDNFEVHAGSGLSGNISSSFIACGKESFAQKSASLSPEVSELANSLSDSGNTPIFITRDGNLIGIISVCDTIKPDAKKSIKELEGMGIKAVMITGDNERCARAIASQIGITDFVSGVMPNEKMKTVSELKKYGKVAMVGDGINDAPALTSAYIGIAIGRGTDIAIDAADVILIKSRPSDITAAIRLGRASLRIIKQNLFWAFFYNVIGIPLAAGAFVHLLGWEMNPMFGAAAMSISSFIVVSNALSINTFDIYSSKKDNKIKVKSPKR